MANVALSAKAVGSVVKLKENGVLVDYLIVHQGLPSSMYDASCNGTWLLRKDVFETRQWHDSDANDYANSKIKAYLDSTFWARFDANIKSVIKQVKIPYRPGAGTSMSVNSGSNGLSCNVFLLSGYEVGWTSADSQNFPIDGANLAYFDAGTNSTANNKRIAYLSNATDWWLRSPRTSGAAYVWRVYADGNHGYRNCSYSYGIRPALVLPSALMVDDSGAVITNVAPSAPNGITVPSTIWGGQNTTVTWGVATDADNNLSGYRLERAVNGGAWGQIYQGTARTYSDAITFGWTKVQYRVRAYDSQGELGAYTTSSVVSVTNNRNPGAPPAINVAAEVVGGSNTTVSWTAATDADGNLTGYRLERSVDGGAWAQIYQGAALTHTSAVTFGWQKIQFRVKAYDAHNWESGYTASGARNIINNYAPAISDSDRSLGTFGQTAPAPAYTVTDSNNDTVTITEALDGKTLRTYTATLGQAATVTINRDVWMTTTNGSHTIKVTANDGRASSTRTWTFVKAENTLIFTLKAPEATDDRVQKILVTPLWQRGNSVKVEVCNNAFDASPTWEDATAMVLASRVYYMQNQAKTATGWGINIRVTMTRGSGETGEINIKGLGGSYD